MVGSILLKRIGIASIRASSSLLSRTCLPPSSIPNSWTRSFITSPTLNNNGKNNNNNNKTKQQQVATLKLDKPMLMLAFTCKKCDTRSSHTISKQAYTKGTVMVSCPGCKNRHLIADHLKIFNDNHITIQDIMKSKGENVSQSTDDLVFEDIPDNLKNIIGHYAKDAPKEMKDKLNNSKIHTLPHKSSE
ncbi:hypothetical protein Kpol_167p1 [Vanderwaltozyma polyspora DSM 70294]|uniref:DNL-type domain-containing protein n=1 Tax=Vanderwaltozyma polyspora (strain ATCC 22028 / DSM 70294 / BCRC 21397 / CBS 2163 / NBRC 10782 / NRRL Y-8283 / UCD 57-17) TaxID=436907 RepID=A7TTS6_VANPO|nr:uncharacterized protein Kpol_167p1 [Vanderwaltozyma polyspora DSM 70294]EDO14328.1 hypothetical protein Kpol_167p1 [Vanderwaltozyma polyspora DSM 70294]